jgi:hypothetical protein
MDVNSYSSTQEIPYLLWNPNVHYHVHKSPVIEPNQMYCFIVWGGMRLSPPGAQAASGTTKPVPDDR